VKLINGSRIKAALRDVSATQIAVAYVGKDWKSYIDSKVLKEIVLSPTLGTNPIAVVELAESLGWENVHFLDNLHSKIYLGDEKAALGSFNLSANALSASGLEEAGFIIEDTQIVASLRKLFNEYKLLALSAYRTKELKIEKLAELRAIWDRGVSTRVIQDDASDGSTRQLADYQPVASDEIYVCWVSGELEYNKSNVRAHTIEDSVNFLADDDVKADRWILYWYAKTDGSPDESQDLCWMHVDEVVENGAIEEKYTKLAIQRNDRNRPQPPFELTNEATKAIYSVLRSINFREFLGNVDPWSVNLTIPKLSAFFKAVQVELNAKISTNGSTKNDDLRQLFASRIRDAMDIAVNGKYVTHIINGMLQKQHAVELAKKLVQPSSEIKSGLKKLAKANLLKLSFESIMLEKQFASLFTKDDLELAQFYLAQVNSNYTPPTS